MCACAGITSYRLYTLFIFLHSIYHYLMYQPGLSSSVKTISFMRVGTLTCSQLYPPKLKKVSSSWQTFNKYLLND